MNKQDDQMRQARELPYQSRLLTSPKINQLKRFFEALKPHIWTTFMDRSRLNEFAATEDDNYLFHQPRVMGTYLSSSLFAFNTGVMGSPDQCQSVCRETVLTLLEFLLCDHSGVQSYCATHLLECGPP